MMDPTIEGVIYLIAFALLVIAAAVTEDPAHGFIALGFAAAVVVPLWNAWAAALAAG